MNLLSFIIYNQVTIISKAYLATQTLTLARLKRKANQLQYKTYTTSRFIRDLLCSSIINGPKNVRNTKEENDKIKLELLNSKSLTNENFVLNYVLAIDKIMLSHTLLLKL